MKKGFLLFVPLEEHKHEEWVWVCIESPHWKEMDCSPTPLQKPQSMATL